MATPHLAPVLYLLLLLHALQRLRPPVSCDSAVTAEVGQGAAIAPDQENVE
jgi:hypothetical protein